MTQRIDQILAYALVGKIMYFDNMDKFVLFVRLFVNNEIGSKRIVFTK